MLLKLAIAVGIGGFMGLLRFLKQKKPKKTNNKEPFDFTGLSLDIGYGAIGALVFVMASAPSEIERVVLTSILGGYLGENAISRIDATNLTKNTEMLKQIEAEENAELPTKEIR